MHILHEDLKDASNFRYTQRQQEVSSRTGSCVACPSTLAYCSDCDRNQSIGFLLRRRYQKSSEHSARLFYLVSVTYSAFLVLFFGSLTVDVFPHRACIHMILGHLYVPRRLTKEEIKSDPLERGATV